MTAYDQLYCRCSNVFDPICLKFKFKQTFIEKKISKKIKIKRWAMLQIKPNLSVVADCMYYLYQLILIMSHQVGVCALQTSLLCVMENRQQGKQHSFLSSARNNSPDEDLVIAASCIIKSIFIRMRLIQLHVKIHTILSLLCHATLSGPVQLSTGMQVPLRQPDLPIFTWRGNVVSRQYDLSWQNKGSCTKPTKHSQLCAYRGKAVWYSESAYQEIKF